MIFKKCKKTPIELKTSAGTVHVAGYPDPVPGETPYPSHLYFLLLRLRPERAGSTLEGFVQHEYFKPQ